MKKLLHIIATPRKENSRTLKVSDTFIKRFKDKFDMAYKELNLFELDLPEFDKEKVPGKYLLLQGNELTDEVKENWKKIETMIQEFKESDVYLISTPMWNFSIPYKLKQYLDLIIQPGYMFKYNENGEPVGLVKNKKMFVISSRGGDYEKGKGMGNYDLLDPYLKTVFGFIGITDITFIDVQPMDAGGEEKRKEEIEKSKKLVYELNL